MTVSQPVLIMFMKPDCRPSRLDDLPPPKQLHSKRLSKRRKSRDEDNDALDVDSDNGGGILAATAS